MPTTQTSRPLARLLATALLSLALTACGGGDDAPGLCRPDFVGPPAPEFADLPVCRPGDGRRVPPSLCEAHPERCA